MRTGMGCGAEEDVLDEDVGWLVGFGLRKK